ncbi:mitochondrial carrier [Xylariaceae sp. FL0016]|nr:mitochondrial carrier [Xylariaceae sp. FL0016]
MTADHNSTKPAEASSPKNYKGFVAGVFSGIAKLTVGHPFDTIKVRLQTTDPSRFSGPLQCVVQTVRHEGVRGLYKGATPPLVGWMFMDSLMLGSLTIYRRLLAEHVFVRDAPAHPPLPRPAGRDAANEAPIAATSHAAAHLPSFGHGIAGVLAGCTVSFIAAPVEHVKARLQIQYSAKKAERLYSGPVDCLRKIYSAHGVRGVYKGLAATLLFRSFFFFWWGSYDVFTRLLRERTNLSAPAINFWAGGVSAQVFWLTSYPSDVVKQRIMTDAMGGKLQDGTPKYRSWRQAAEAVYRDAGMKGYWRGFVPCFLRAFPANAVALVAFEGVMRSLP